MAEVFFDHPRMVVAVPLPLPSSVLAVAPDIRIFMIISTIPSTLPRFNAVVANFQVPRVRRLAPFAIVVAIVHPDGIPIPIQIPFIVISGIAKPPCSIDEDTS